MPQALAKLSRQLEDSGKVDEFRALEPKKAMNWLKSNLPKVYHDVCAFLEDHGHRAVMEVRRFVINFSMRSLSCLRHVLKKYVMYVGAVCFYVQRDIRLKIELSQVSSSVVVELDS